MSLTVRPGLLLIPIIALVLAAGLGGAGVSRAQSQTSSQDVLGGLLTEVRGLRVAIETMASAGPRVQLALGRLQLQDQRVTEISRRLTDTRQALAASQQQHDAFQQQLKAINEGLVTGIGAEAEARRQEIEQATRMMKAEWPRIEAEIQRLQTEEATLVQELSVEQSRLSELNQRLDEVERSLGRR
jgi:chromosome segregation ATPase